MDVGTQTGSVAEVEMYLDEDAAYRALHIIDRNGDYQINADELKAIVAVAWS